MSTEIEEFSKALIEKALKLTNWNYVTDRDGDHMVSFKQSSKLGGLNVWFLSTKSGDSLKCIGLYEIDIHKDNLSTALYLCNEFHNQYSFPCVYVRHPEDSEGSFYCQAFFDLEKGIHVEGLANFMQSFTGSCAAFEQWVCKQSEFWL